MVITRDKTGSLNAVINACAHKGAMLCRRKQGNEGSFTCPFHGWTFSNTGKLLEVKDARTMQYPELFGNDGSHDLTWVALFESYCGFLLGSLNPDVAPLQDYLGATTTIIDQTTTESCRSITSARCIGTMYRVPCSAAKGGGNAITRSLAMELAGQNIRVVATPPGGTEAPPRRVVALCGALLVVDG